jgi:hypothetical protein
MIVCASPSTASGATPLLLASPLTLTWMQTCSGGLSPGRDADRRSAIFARSMPWTQSKCSEIDLVLLLWIRPM